MTEKRFQWNERIDGRIVEEFVVDNLTKKELDEEDMCDLLNKLNDEIKELEIEYRRLARFLMKNGYTISDYLDYCEENEFK